jgi:hypothetical protein
MHAQTGPAGVGDPTTNHIWLRADDLQLTDGEAVASWPDASGNGNSAAQVNADFQPTFVASGNLNGRAAVRLDGNDDRLIIADDDALDGTAGITYFAVIRPNNLDGTPHGILGKRIDFTVETDYSYTWFFWENADLNLDVNDNSHRFNSLPTTFSNATNYLLGWDFDGGRAATERSRIYSANQTVATAANPQTSLNASSVDVVIGALNDNYRAFIGADYAELIHFNYALNDLERNLVATYLSAKYAIPLANGDLYAYDSPVEGDFDHNVAGIGRDVSGDQIREARGTGVVTIGGPAILPDDTYLVWGNDGGGLALTEFSDLPPGTSSRSGRSWRANERTGAGGAADVGTIAITFDLRGISPPPTGELRLLIDTNGDGSFADETPIAGAEEVAAGQYRFGNIDQIVNGARFTLATAETALPGRFYDFSAEAVGNDARLAWSVFEEERGEYFAVDRSRDGITWDELSRIHLADRDDYTYRDVAVNLRRAYYRVRQVGYDRTFTVTPVRELRFEYTADVAAFPNPFTGTVRIENVPSAEDRPLLLDGQGRPVRETHSVRPTGVHELSLDGRNLASGIYYLRWEDGRMLRLLRR